MVFIDKLHCVTKRMNGRNGDHDAVSSYETFGKQIAKVEGYSEILLDADVVEFEVSIQMLKTTVEEIKLSSSKRIEYIIYVVKTYNVKAEKDVQVRQILNKENNDFRLMLELHITCSDLKTYENIANKLTEKLDGSVGISSPKQRHSSANLQRGRERAVKLSVEDARRKALQMARISGQEAGLALHLEEIECRQEDEQIDLDRSVNLPPKVITKITSKVFAVYELVNVI